MTVSPTASVLLKKLLLNLISEDAKLAACRVVPLIDQTPGRLDLDRPHLHVVGEDSVDSEGPVVDVGAHRQIALNLGLMR